MLTKRKSKECNKTAAINAGKEREEVKEINDQQSL